MGQSAGIEDALAQAIGHGLMLLGENVKRTVYYCIESKYHVKREEIPEKLDTFHEALEGLLGTGARFMERQIARNLYSRLGLKFTPRIDWTIVEYYADAKKIKRGC